MRKLILGCFLVLFLLSVVSYQLLVTSSFAATCDVADCSSPDDCQNKIAECQQLLSAYSPAQSKNKEQLAALEKQVRNTENLIKAAEAQIKKVEKDIFDREVKLAYQQEVFNAKVRSFYIRSQRASLFLLLLASDNAANLARELSYRLAATQEDKRMIVSITQDLAKLKTDKEKLDVNKIWLAKIKQDVGQQTAFLRKEVEKVDSFLGTISGKIASLTAKQQALLTARAGTFTTSVGEVPVSSIPCSGPPGTPTFCDPGSGVWFASFSFGAWTHRKGLSQYGARGRAEAGQNFEQILQAYYGRGTVDKDTGGTIAVFGFGNLDFENYYLSGIAEMPSSWNKEALKAQAVAARSYAYRYKLEGRAICTTQACQVFSKAKADNPPAEWRQAVQETKGKVVEGVTAFYSSTAGGYLTTSGWDTTDGQGGPGFATRAWESKAGSPWFYSSWFSQNYTSGSAKCGRSHPWLNQEEIADILNAWLVLNKNGSDERILPVTINQCPIGGVSGNPYSLNELREKTNSLGGAFTSVNSISVTYSSSGETGSLNFETNKGGIAISGSEFKQAFNLRAPGYISIRSPLFNIETK